MLLFDLVDESLVAVPGRFNALDSAEAFFSTSAPSDLEIEDHDSGVGGGRGSRFVLKMSARTDFDLVACALLLCRFPTLFSNPLAFLAGTFSTTGDCCLANRSCGSNPSVEVELLDAVSGFANVPQPPTPVFENVLGNPPGLEGPSLLFVELLRHAVLCSDRAWQEIKALRSLACPRNNLTGSDEVAEIDNARSCCDLELTARFCRQNAHTKGWLRSWNV